MREVRREVITDEGVPMAIIPEDPRDGVDYFSELQGPSSQTVPAPGAVEGQSVSVVVEQHRPGKFMRGVKTLGIGSLALSVGIAGIQVKQWIDEIRNPFSMDSSHAVDLTVGAPETEVYENAYLNLATMQAKIPVSLDTTLLREFILLRPFSCNTKTRHTGAKGEDDKIATTTETGLVVDSLSVSRVDGEVKVRVDGDITMSNTSVDYKQNKINVEGASGGIDVCVGTNEMTWARSIVDIAVQEAGKVATSCALQDPAGREAFEAGIRTFVSNTDLGRGLSDTDLANMRIEMEGYSVSADALYGKTANDFRQAVDEVIGEYLNETEDESHQEPKINDRDLLNCEKHDISFVDTTAES